MGRNDNALPRRNILGECVGQAGENEGGNEAFALNGCCAILEGRIVYGSCRLERKQKYHTRDSA